MHQKKLLTESELVKRSQELQAWAETLDTRELLVVDLDARSDFLDAREQLAKQLELEIVVMNETLSVKSKQLHEHKQSLILIQAETAVLEEQSIAIVETQTAQLARYEERLAKLKNKEADYHTKCSVVLESLRETKNSITERAEYLKTQEEHINEAIGEGSIKLTSLKYEIDDLELTKKLLSQEITNFLLEKQTAYIESSEAQQELDSLKDRYQIKLDDYNELLIQAQDDYAKQVAATKEISDEVDAKLTILKIKELETLAKREAIKRETEELQLQKRRSSGIDSLYNV